MTRRWIQGVLIASCWALGTPSVVGGEGGTANGDPWAAKFQRAEWVSLVTVQGIGSLVNPALAARPGVYAVEGYRYTATRLRDWKGSTDDSFTFRVDLSGCQSVLRLERDYVVFGTTDHRGNRQVLTCDHLVPRDLASDFLGELDQYSRVNTATDAPAS